jgi:CxxC motif-containing protein (DUF1111 family)
MKSIRHPCWFGAAALAWLSACSKPPAPVQLDDPLPGLTPEERARFDEGEEIFEGTFTAEQGLGPLFNAEGCAVCHGEPTDGGAGAISEVHVSAVGAEGECDSLVDLGGPVIQQRATPALEALGIPSEPVPDEATSRARRTTPDIFGFGLLDAVPDATIWALADPDDRDGDGVSGRVHVLPGGHVGRFGRKANGASLAAFNAGAFRIEMGLTSTGEPVENSIAGNPLPEGVDPLPEPELTDEEIDRVNDYVRFLAPPAPAPLHHDARKGGRVFEQIGCATCHVPSLLTGEHEVRALSHKEVAAYTDLLLHDMGPDLADICMGDASPSEFRTEPLMGLRHMTRFLHDGRATTVTDAILAHGGEATRSRTAFADLGESERKSLLAFLATL